VHAQPDNTEPASSQQPNSSKIIWKSFSKLGVFVGCEVAAHVEAVSISVLLIDIDGLFLSVLAVAEGLSLLHAACLFEVARLLPALLIASTIEQLF
jgi:hypothetical protein